MSAPVRGAAAGLVGGRSGTPAAGFGAAGSLSLVTCRFFSSVSAAAVMSAMTLRSAAVSIIPSIWRKMARARA